MVQIQAVHTAIKWMNYHVGVSDLLLCSIPVAVVVWEQLLQSSEGSVGLRFLLIGTSPFELLPIDLHLDRRTVRHFVYLQASLPVRESRLSQVRQLGKSIGDKSVLYPTKRTEMI